VGQKRWYGRRQNRSAFELPSLFFTVPGASKRWSRRRAYRNAVPRQAEAQNNGRKDGHAEGRIETPALARSVRPGRAVEKMVTPKGVWSASVSWANARPLAASATRAARAAGSRPAVKIATSPRVAQRSGRRARSGIRCGAWQS